MYFGGGVKKIELHFLHYSNFAEAKECWERRKSRINKDNLFAILTFTEGTYEEWLARFERIPLKNKVAFTERPYPQYHSAYHIKGFEKSGLGQLNYYQGFFGKRKIDQFDYVSWFNSII